MPLHVLLYRAFGWEAPEFAHLPLIMKPVGNGKLSKRDGDKLGFPVFPLNWTDPISGEKSSGYREKGFFPEAVINFLALLGWNDGTDKELFSLEELENAFDLNRVHKAGAKFDPEKNKWFNHQYLIKKNDAELAKVFAPVLAEKRITVSENNLTKIVSLIKERADFVSEFWDLSDFFFVAPTSYDEKAKKNWNTATPALMQELISVLSEITDFTSVNIETIVKDWMTKNEIGMGKVMQPFRLSLVGALKGPHLFDIVELIGKEETIKRIEKAIASL
jgi:glutamyl-tRNA synthetase